MALGTYTVRERRQRETFCPGKKESVPLKQTENTFSSAAELIRLCFHKLKIEMVYIFQLMIISILYIFKSKDHNVFFPVVVERGPNIMFCVVRQSDEAATYTTFSHLKNYYNISNIGPAQQQQQQPEHRTTRRNEKTVGILVVYPWGYLKKFVVFSKLQPFFSLGNMCFGCISLVWEIKIEEIIFFNTSPLLHTETYFCAENYFHFTINQATQTVFFPRFDSSDKSTGCG